MILETRPTIRDVARHVRVSPGTVSNVFANRATVHAELRERVTQVAAQLGHQPNDVAASLRRPASRTIGIAFPYLAVHLFVDLLQLLERAAEADGYALVFVDCHEYRAGKAQRLQRLIGRRVDGLFIVPMAHFAQSAAVLAASDQLIVVVGRMDDADGRFAAVANDNHAAGETALGFLAERGHGDIMLVVNSDALWSSRARIEGFRAAAARHGLSASCEVLTAGMTLAETERAADAALARRIPSAIVGASGVAILGVLQSVQRRKRRVPEDMALLAFDNVAWMSVLRPSMSTVRQPIAKIAAEAWAMMSAQLGSRDVGRQRIRLPDEIIEPESTRIAEMPLQELSHVG